MYGCRLPGDVLQRLDRSADMLHRFRIERRCGRVGPQILEQLCCVRELGHARLERRHRATDRALIELRQVRLEPARQRIVIELANVLTVDPVELFPVESRARMLHAVEREGVYELVEREDLLRRAGIPAEQRKVVDERLGQVALLAKEHQVGFRVLAFGQLGPVFGEDQRHVGESKRPVIAERVDEHQLIGRVGEMLLAADHVGDLHRRVIDRACKLIGRKSIGLDDDEIADQVGVESHIAADHVLELHLPARNLEAHCELHAVLRWIDQATA